MLTIANLKKEEYLIFFFQTDKKLQIESNLEYFWSKTGFVVLKIKQKYGGVTLRLIKHHRKWQLYNPVVYIFFKSFIWYWNDNTASPTEAS